jgi:type II secretory pathway predicted ATPase ExeA
MAAENSSIRRPTTMSCKHFFGLQKEPFAQDIKVSDLFPLSCLSGVSERVRFALDLGAATVITGEVGSGKSTSLRYASSQLHPSKYKIIPVIAHSGTVMELCRQIGLALNVETRSPSLTTVVKTVRTVIGEIALRKELPVLIIDEAHLMRLEVFSQLHTLLQFDFDSKPLVPLVLAGHNTLMDKLLYHTSRPLASRVVGKSHLDGLKLKEMQAYLKHHLEIAGIKEQLFCDEAVLAIHQGSGGLLRRANNLARGALVAAAMENLSVVSAEHVRIASTELI